ncbi:MAG TPA: PAS domain S-box protein [Gemmatimonadaceae bacterium]|nr:PAS domain S-box protein [Gemmatimonadaceae bacterium]
MGEMQRRQEALLANIPDAAFMLDHEGRFVAVNDELLRVLGRGSDAVIGRTEFDLFAGPVAAEHHAANQRVFETGQRLRVEEEIPLPGGRTMWVETVKTPYFDEQGAPAGIVGIARDVTERRRAVDALRQSEAWFRAISEQTSELILVIDAERRTIYQSPSHETVLGYAPDELLGRSPFDHFHPDERGPAEAMFGELLRAESREVASARIRFRHANGSYRTLEIVARSLVGEPAVAGVVVNSRDVTEQELAKAARREAEREAREMAERMHTVARAAADVVDADSVAALQEVAYRACRAVIPFDVFTFGLYDAAAHALRFRQNSWSGAEQVDVLPLAGRPAERVVRERRSLLTLRADDPRAEGMTVPGGGRPPESVIRTPIVAGDQVLGVVSVQSYTPDSYTERDAELLEAVAALAATALKKIRLIDDLRESEERFRSITEAAGDAVVSADAQGNVLTWNPAAVRTFGYDAAEIIGRPMTTIMPEQTQAASVQGDEEGAAGRTIELDAVRRDGSRVPVELSLSMWETGGDRRYGAIMRDVTGRRREEAKLRESEERYAMAARATSDVIWDLDIASGRIAAVGAWAQTFGFPELPEITFDWFVGRVHPDDVERVRAGLLAALAGASNVWTDEFRFRRADDTYATVRDHGYVARDDAGRPVRMVGSLADITARREAEDRVRQSERLLAWSQQIAHVGSWELDLATQRLTWSDELWRIFGHQPGAFETSYEHFDALLHPDDRGPIAAVMERLIATGKAEQAEYRIVRRDGSVRLLAGRAEVVAGAAGAPARVAGTAQDVTEAKAAEAELRAAKEAAESASQAKSEFLANMSHEIRTPMNGVLGMVDLALETPLSPEQRDYLAVARGSAQSLLGVIDDVLDFSKIEARKLDMDAAPFDLGAGLGDALRVLAPRARTKGLALTLDVRPEVPESLIGDVGRLRQVVMNLVGNAIKFTERGAVTVRVDVAEQGDRGVALHFAVSDTGIGIPRNKQAAIFEAFQQADTSTTRVYGGTGLGLTISSRLVELMGGRIWVVSREGQGSTFHFTARFGVRIAGPRAAAAAAPNVAAAPAAPAAARPLRVLLAEDNAVNRKLAVALLSRRGHAVVATTNGREALAAWEGAAARGAERFDLVLMDVQMPEMDGFAATGAIRAREAAAGPSAPRTPIIALTARAMIGDRERCLEAGMDAYVSKPIQAPALFAAIEAAVSPSAEGDGGAASTAASAVPPELPPELPPEGVFDEGALLTFVEGSADLLRELAGLFLEDAPRYVAEIRSAVEQGDAAALQAAAHTLKGAAGSMTARRVADAARDLESAARAADLSAAPAALSALERELAHVRAALEPIAA